MRLFRLDRLSTRGRYAALSAGLALLIGVLFAVEERGAALDRATSAHEAGLAARLSGARPPGGVADGKLPRREARSLDRSLGELASRGAGSVRLWNKDGGLVYSGGRPLDRSSAEISAALDSALHGRIDSTRVANPGGAGDDLATLVPLRTGETVAAYEIRRPWKSVAARADFPSWQGLLPLTGTLALVWLGILGIAALATAGRSPGTTPLSDGQSDPLTDLPNRSAFRDSLERALISGKRSPELVAVLLMDVDRFKEINDTLGHYNGDLLLKRMGPRLRSVLRDQDTVARLGGDEFAILLPHIHDYAAVVGAAERIVRIFEEPFVLGGLALEVEASVGVAIYPDHGNRVDVLLNHADTAMYAAKAARTGFAVYSDEQDQGSRRRLALAGELRRAINEHEIVLTYQPKAHIASGAVTGVEALARWQHPVEGVISPSEFIPIAEQTNLLHALTERILDQALEQLRDWRARGFELTMAVNLSMRNLLDATLADQIAERLRRYSIKPSKLELELTEGMLMSDPRRAKEILLRLKEVGVGLSVDDFGTGYSSLAYLKDLPVDTIKIDRSFVIDMETEPRNAAIVRSTVDLGRNLGLEVVAEGVETQTAYDELARLGCDYAQGYLLARPLAAPELLARVQELEQARERTAAVPPAQERALRVVPSQVIGA
jgi:diguanylate cyclase (GGDEF)-like protein